MNHPFKSRSLIAAAAFGVAVLPLAIPSSAHAWWQDGVYVDEAPPVVVSPPPAYSPPVYEPPTVYAAPPNAYRSLPRETYRETYQDTPESYLSSQLPYPEAPYSYRTHSRPPLVQSCFTELHACPLAHPLPAGSNCSCPGDESGWIAGQAG